MRRRLFGLLLAAGLAATGLRAQQPPVATSGRGQAPAPTFRSDVAAVLVDFRVTNREGRFVNDLTDADIQIFENGVAQRISTFSMIEIPISPAPPARTWPGMPPPDTATNADANGRLYLIALDDVNVNPHRAGTIQELARLFITSYLGPNDRAALVATSGRTALAREFTGDRQRLLAAVDKVVAGFGAFDLNERTGNKMAARSTFRYLESMADWLGALEGRRKAIVFISEGFTAEIPMGQASRGGGDAGVSTAPGAATDDTGLPGLTDGPRDDQAGVSVFDQLAAMSDDAMDFREAINAAARANVSIYAIDPRGNPAAPVTDIKPVTNLAGDDPLLPRRIVSRQMLASLGAETGGFSVTGTNDFGRAFERVVRENSSYYLLGYSSSNPARDRKFRRIQVKTTRPGLRIRARTGYVAERPESSKPEALPKGWTPEVLSLMRSPAPVTGLTLEVTAAAFRGESSQNSVTVVVEADGLSARQGSSDGSLPVTLVVVAADGSGKIQATGFASFSPAHASGAPGRPVRAVSRLPLKPGTYALRVAGTARDNSLRGSVFYDLDVPKFGKEKLEMSGVTLSSKATSAFLTSGADRTWREEGVDPPTTRRHFAAGDELTASVEIYDNDSRQPRAIETVTSVERESGERVFSSRERLIPAAGSRGMMRHRAVIPLSGMTPGNYVLTLEATAVTSVVRKIPFSIAARAE